jgi:basic membrane protein A and related proteins
MTKKLFIILALIIIVVFAASCAGPAAEEPVAEEPVAEEPAVEEPAAEEPAVEEPAAEEPAAEEPAAEEPAMEAPTEVRICALLGSGLDVAWDATMVESYNRVIENPPLGLTMPELKYTEGLYGDEAEAAMRDFAESGDCDIIWPQGGHNQIIDNVKGDYPDIMFVEIGSGMVEFGDNNYYFWHRCHEPGYLIGMLAAKMSESGVIGAIGGFPAGDVNDIMNGYAAGAKSVNPDIKIKYAFVNSWWDPVKAGEEANAQIAAGVDAIYQMSENFDACVENDIYCFGPYIDYSQYYPDNVLANSVATWDATIVWTIETWYEAMTSGEGFNATEEVTFSMSQGGVCDLLYGSALEGEIPQEVKDEIAAAKQEIMDGTLVVPLNLEAPVSD